ncbi:hypothetical protein GY45DRAFT_1375421 [Cubamyces sp. BRFM 1775]|nr:hypothetical protein GY45DRAFT_1375421 [Cubamyces sp. BRFM 1775]
MASRPMLDVHPPVGPPNGELSTSQRRRPCESDRNCVVNGLLITRTKAECRERNSAPRKPLLVVLLKLVSAAKGDIHSSITRLALQFSTYKITGANASLHCYCHRVQDDCGMPPKHTLSCHLMTYISPQNSPHAAARPMSLTVGNAIRQLKLNISGIDFDLPEQDTRDALRHQTDTHIRERIYREPGHPGDRQQ